MNLEELGIKQTNYDAMQYKGTNWKECSLKDWLQFCKANEKFREPGISYDELRALHEACEILGPRPARVVETGMCYGATTRYFLVRAAKYGGGEVWTYEIKPKPLFVSMLHELGLWNWLNLRGHSMKDYYDGGKIDMLFIDSEHALQDALGEYMRFRPYLDGTSIIGFHDCDMCPGVGKALQIIQEVDELKVVSRSGGKMGAGVIFFKRVRAGRTDRPWQKKKGRELYEWRT